MLTCVHVMVSDNNFKHLVANTPVHLSVIFHILLISFFCAYSPNISSVLITNVSNFLTNISSFTHH